MYDYDNNQYLHLHTRIEYILKHINNIALSFMLRLHVIHINIISDIRFLFFPPVISVSIQLHLCDLAFAILHLIHSPLHYIKYINKIYDEVHSNYYR